MRNKTAQVNNQFKRGAKPTKDLNKELDGHENKRKRAVHYNQVKGKGSADEILLMTERVKTRVNVEEL